MIQIDTEKHKQFADYMKWCVDYLIMELEQEKVLIRFPNKDNTQSIDAELTLKHNKD